eukprot:7379013-Prymnesium_polylepis.1
MADSHQAAVGEEEDLREWQLREADRLRGRVGRGDCRETNGNKRTHSNVGDRKGDDAATRPRPKGTDASRAFPFVRQRWKTTHARAGRGRAQAICGGCTPARAQHGSARRERSPSTKVTVELCEANARVEPVASKHTSRTHPKAGISKKSVPSFGFLPHLVSASLPSTDLMYAEKTRHL